jgi:hypothetical protein
MKRISVLFVLLFALCGAASAGFNGVLEGFSTPVVASGGGNDPATTAWVNQVVSRGGTVSGTQTTNVNNLIVCLKTTYATNFFSISDRLYLLASENATQATTDLITPSGTQATSTATFNAVGGTAPFGYAGNGTSTFYDSKWIPSSGPNCVLNSCTIMLYDGSTTFSGRLGVLDGSSNTLGLRFLSTTSVDFYLNGTGGTGQTVTNVKSILIGTRTLAGATQTFQNGSSVGTGTDASTTIPGTYSFWAAGGQNAFGNFSSGSTDTIGAFGALSGLTATQAGQYNTCIQNYLTAWGA